MIRRTGKTRFALLLGLAALGCQETPSDPPAPSPATGAPATEAPGSTASTPGSTAPAPGSTAPAPPSAAVNTTPAPPALRAAWRESVQYRASFKALAQNTAGLVADKARMARMIKETRMYEVIPVAPVPGADAQALEKSLNFHAERLGLEDVQVEVKTDLPRRGPPARVLNTEGVHYTPEQLVGTHHVTLRFPDRARAEAYVRALRQLPRAPLLKKIRTQKKATVITGVAPYFIHLAPTQIYRAPPRPDAIIARAGGAGSTVAEKLKANYAEVDALQPQIDAAFALEAELKLTTSRFSAFAAHAEALEQMSWLVLTGARPPAKGKPGRGGHGH